MHKSKIDCFKRSTQHKILLSGVMRRSVQRVPMGMPVILAITDPNVIPTPKKETQKITKKHHGKPKKKINVSGKSNNWAVKVDSMRSGREGRLPSPSPDSWSGNKKRSTITHSLSGKNSLKKDTLTKDIIRLVKNGKNVTEVNKLLRESTLTAQLIVPFPQYPNSILISTQIHACDFFYNGKIPIIEDDGVVIAEVITDQSKTPSIISDPTKIIEDCIDTLQTNRFMNINVSNITDRTFKSISQDLTKLFSKLTDTFKYNSSCYMFGDGNCTLIDTISISFYSLADMIQLFSTKHLQGVGIELTAFNSHDSKNDKFTDHAYATTVHMLFANESEGITSIDGENIERAYAGSVHEDLSTFLDCITRNVPLDITQQQIKTTKQTSLF